MTNEDSQIESLYRGYAPSAFRRARRLLGNEAEAQEIVHDVFLSLFERPEQFRGQSRLSTFLYSAVTHACLNRIRDRQTRVRLLREEHAVAQRIVHTTPVGPDDHALLRSWLAQMPDALAKLAVYYYMDELTHEEIAQLLGCSRRYVGYQLERLSAWLQAQRKAS